jgi:hypothetical protein
MWGSIEKRRKIEWKRPIINIVREEIGVQEESIRRWMEAYR